MPKKRKKSRKKRDYTKRLNLGNPRPPSPHKGRVALVKHIDGTVRVMTAHQAAARMASSKGGRVAQANGKGHRFTSESGRKAALKVWKTRWRKSNYSGARIGRAANMPRVKHAPLREKYAANPTPEVAYFPHIKKWIADDVGGIRVISEKLALQRLGHIASMSGPVPISIVRTLPHVKPKGKR